MTRARFLVGAIAASLAMSVAPAFAQRSASSGEATGGSAVSRGGGDSGGGGAVSRGDSGGSSSSAGSSGSSSTPSVGSPSQPAREYVTAPTRPSERAQGRTRGGGSSSGSSGSSGRAVPRDSGGGAPAGGATTRSAGGPSSAPSDRAVPAYSRPRAGRPSRGTAVERTFPPVDGGGRIIYYPRFYGRSYYLPAYGLGLGFYDPFWYDPYYYGGFGAYGYPYGGYGYGYGAAYGSGSYDRVGTGSLRLKIKPRDAEVYVDGYFAGTVDEFDGLFQKLRIDAGGHRIEIRAEGYEVTAFDVLITPGETVTYKGELKPIP